MWEGSGAEMRSKRVKKEKFVKLCALLIFLKRVWAGVGPQSGYAYEGTGTAGQFDYRLQIYNNNYLTWNEDISKNLDNTKISNDFILEWCLFTDK